MLLKNVITVTLFTEIFSLKSSEKSFTESRINLNDFKTFYFNMNITFNLLKLMFDDVTLLLYVIIIILRLISFVKKLKEIKL